MSIEKALQAMPATTLMQIVQRKINVASMARRELHDRGLVVNGRPGVTEEHLPLPLPEPLKQQHCCDGCQHYLVRQGEHCPGCYHQN